MAASSDAMIEAQAFIGRCRKPIFDLYREGCQQADVVFYLEQVAGLPAVVLDRRGQETIELGSDELDGLRFQRALVRDEPH